MKNIFSNIIWRWRLYQLGRMMSKFDDCSRSRGFRFIQYVHKTRKIMGYAGIDMPDLIYDNHEKNESRIFSDILNKSDLSSKMIKSAEILIKRIN